MKNTSKRIIISVLTLVLTVVALGTTTFAWFSLSNVSEISGIEGKITGGDGLEVALFVGDKNITGFKNNLTSDDFKKVIDELDFEEFAAITTTDGENFTKMVQEDGKLHLSGKADPKDYLKFTIKFRSQNGGKVKLTNLEFAGITSTLSNDGLVSYKQISTQDNEESYTNYEVTSSAANAARVMFGKSADNTFQHKGEELTIKDDKVVGNTVMEDKAVEHGQWSYLTKSKGLKIYSQKDSSDEIDINDITIINAKTDGFTSVEASLEGPENIFEASIDVTIWIEGWDADTYDSVFNSKLTINMQFTKEETNPEG